MLFLPNASNERLLCDVGTASRRDVRANRRINRGGTPLPQIVFKHITGNDARVQDLSPQYKLMKLLSYYKVLLKNRKRLTRRYQDLNLLWRDMNFVRTRLITDRLINKDRIPYQLDFCRSEAESLGLAGDPEIQTKMTQAAEELDPSKKAQVGDDGKARRLAVSLMVRLNDFRIRRLFQQLYKVRMYALLCFSLLVLSLIMFNLQPVLTANLQHQAFIGPPQAIHSTATVPAEGQPAGALGGYKASPETIVHPDDRSPLLVRSASALESTTFKKKIGLFFTTLFHWIADKIAGNPLVFIFFGGLTGGIFSAMMRFQPALKGSPYEPFDQSGYQMKAIQLLIVLGAALLCSIMAGWVAFNGAAARPPIGGDYAAWLDPVQDECCQ